ncbi:MAG: enoyl-CoA hydratase [Mycolicibacterium sp.]|jgi:enoyl-CoA hydratase/carnithine racemase
MNGSVDQGSDSGLLVEQVGPQLTITFDRPAHHNAMTSRMYDALFDACDRADEDDTIRIMVLRGAGGRSFVSGSDISSFTDFGGPDDAVTFERRMSATIVRLSRVEIPVVAAIDGFCLGAGLAIAMACDIRIASPCSRFGVPIARTLGNTLSAEVFALALRHFGHSRTTDMVLNARFFDAAEMQQCGFVSLVSDEVADATATTVERILGHAPLTLWAAKELLRRLHSSAPIPDDTDVLRRVYGSADFTHGVRAFLEKTPRVWTGN